jgi:hypothetical protein
MLKPEASLSVGLATAALVYATYNGALPSVADVRVAKPNNADVNSSRRLAAFTSAGVVGAVSLMAKDPTVFVIGGAMVIALDWWHRYADQVNPAIGKVAGAIGVTPTAAQAGAGDYSSADFASSYVA